MNNNNLMVKRVNDITDMKAVYESFMRLKKKPEEIEVAINLPQKKEKARL